MRGLAYANKMDYDKAIVDYTDAIRLRPNADTYTNRGITHVLKKDCARADWEKALQLDPNNTDAKDNLARLQGMGY